MRAHAGTQAGTRGRLGMDGGREGGREGGRKEGRKEGEGKGERETGRPPALFTSLPRDLTTYHPPPSTYTFPSRFLFLSFFF